MLDVRVEAGEDEVSDDSNNNEEGDEAGASAQRGSRLFDRELPAKHSVRPRNLILGQL